ncbi:MAG: hypothetical protein LBF13_03835 [Campylobacteraceae bacterium]|jgi:predicted Ser/Thr protein kinase|nr:hypothetical protein [Campylobacteraceae bacterium]
MPSNYPNSNEYRAAFQHVRESLTDPILKEGVVKTNSLGPQVFSGNFVYAYEITSQYRIKYAVRCFRYPSRDREERYAAISKFLKQLKSYYFVDFEYQSDGISIGGVKYPIVKMAWIDGVLLGQFIAENYSNRRRLKNLITSLIALARFIEHNGLAHGDIQTSNIMVNNDGKDLRLIDYDGMYVKNIRELGNCECGTPNFQHPQRDNAWNSKLDRFSFICLYVALNALIEQYSLWEELSCDEESILFVASDYEDTKNSKAFRKLMKIENMKEDTQKFKRICEVPFDKIPSLDDFIAGDNIPNYYHTSKFVYFASAIIILVAGVVYFLENGYTINTIYQKISIKEQSAKTVSEPQEKTANIYNTQDYSNTIKQLDDLYAQLPNDNDIRLLSAVTYAISGYDDVKLSALIMPLQAKNLEDYRLYFALAAFYWRKHDMHNAKYFIDLAKNNPHADNKLKRLSILFADIIAIQLNAYNRYKSAFNGKDSEIFAEAMVLWEDNYILKEYFEKIYLNGFIGFSNEYKFNIERQSFVEWFDAYANYNMGKGLKSLIKLYEQYPKNALLLYSITTSIANLHIEGSEGKCYFRRDKYLKIAKEFSEELTVLNAKKAIDFAKKLIELPFSQAKNYYALSLAYYANGEFEIAGGIANIAKAKLMDEDSSEMREKIETLSAYINDSIACRLHFAE